jgi:hydrogenase maturation protease
MHLRNETLLKQHAGKYKLAIVGVGNRLAGDDGVGIETVRRLAAVWGEEPAVLLHMLEGDHFEIADLIDRAERFIFVDAVEGESPGELVFMGNARRAFAPSFHQTDVAAVMHSLEAIRAVDPFPAWEILGITILPPTELGEGLSPYVEMAAGQLYQRLSKVISEAIQ